MIELPGNNQLDFCPHGIWKDGCTLTVASTLEKVQLLLQQCLELEAKEDKIPRETFLHQLLSNKTLCQKSINEMWLYFQK